MSPRFIHFLQVLALIAMVLSALLPFCIRVPALALGAIAIERTFKPLCISIIQRIN
jgi:hypothetical protein